MKTAKQIYKEHWARWVTKEFLSDNEPPANPDDLPEEEFYLWIESQWKNMLNNV